MREIPLTVPEIGMINSTRFIIGIGVGLLLAGTLNKHARKPVGLSLLFVGTLVSIPVAMAFLGKIRGSQSQAPQITEKRAA
jgi:hypothetical protein